MVVASVKHVFMKYRVLNIICSILGVAVSLYAYYVEVVKSNDASYEALCDFSPNFSCSKVLTSRWGKGFGLFEYVVGHDHWLNQPNSVFGVIFYTMFILVGETRSAVWSRVQFNMAVVSNIMSVYLAYILIFILYDLCIVCVITYAINFFLLLLSLWKISLLKKMKLS